MDRQAREEGKEERRIAGWAASQGLEIVPAESLAIKRHSNGKGFFYRDTSGRQVCDPATLDRIRSLAIPPAYKDVRIARKATAHLQAIGRDEAGRLQYRYHPRWDEVRNARKFQRLGALSAALPQIRRRVARDLRREGLPRKRILAAVVTLLDRTHIRIGCEDYVHSGQSRGAATLVKRNVRQEGERLWLAFRGKGGKAVECAVRAPALARLVEALLRLPGARLFKYRDENGRLRPVTAGDVNAYLQEVSGLPITAKDFRTLAATSLAAERLLEAAPDLKETQRRKLLRAVIKDIAAMLANTPATARKSYVHPRLIEVFHADGLRALAARQRRGRPLSRGEAVTWALFAKGRGLPGETKASP